jgi:hypothetical protein
MNVVVLNPENYKEKYLEYLNNCFPNWGDAITYDWVFERRVGQHKADIILLNNEEGEVIAGSAVTYRCVKSKNGISVDFGIMTGSWTLPEARGRGCFSQIIEESKRICFSKNVPFLTAFVTESNASYRRLKDAGFYCKKADNIFSNETVFTTNTDFSIVEIVTADTQVLYDKLNQFPSLNSSFAYSKEEFEKQYIKRLNSTVCVKINETYFLFEETTTIVKLLFISDFNLIDLQCFCDWIRVKKDKKVMFFLSDETKIKLAEDHNFHIVKSFFTIQKTDDSLSFDYEIFKNISINLGDKM